MKSHKIAECSPPHGAQHYDFSIYPAIRKRIAGFFYSTQFHKPFVKKTKYENIDNITSAVSLKWLRFFFVVKSRYMTFYQPRAPPSELECHNHKFKNGGLTMIITYKFADDTVSAVEVEDELGLFILESRKDEENLSRKERYHGFSIEGCLYEGIELSTDESPEKILQREVDKKRLEKRFDEAVNSLSETQRRRLKLLIKGLSMRDIGRIEGVSSHSVAKSIWGARKIFLKFFPERRVTKWG